MPRRERTFRRSSWRLKSRCLIQGPNGRREISMEEFLTGVNTTDLEAEELLCAIVVPVPQARREASFRRVARTVVDIALVSAAVSLTADAGTITGGAHCAGFRGAGSGSREGR